MEIRIFACAIESLIQFSKTRSARFKLGPRGRLSKTKKRRELPPAARWFKEPVLSSASLTAALLTAALLTATLLTTTLFFALALLTFALLFLFILLLAALLSRGFARFVWWILLCVHNAFLCY